MRFVKIFNIKLLNIAQNNVAFNTIFLYIYDKELLLYREYKNCDVKARVCELYDPLIPERLTQLIEAVGSAVKLGFNITSRWYLQIFRRGRVSISFFSRTLRSLALIYLTRLSYG